MYHLAFLMPLVSTKCYADWSDTKAIADCNCHESCNDCGYNDMPVFSNDCVDCPKGFSIFPVYDDGTGYCLKNC